MNYHVITENGYIKRIELSNCSIGQNITESEYNRLLAEIREKAELVNQLYNGEITIADVPEAWREEIQRRVDERIAAEGAAEEQDISAEEALDIILGGAT